MTLYARPSWMLVRQVIADAFVLTWAAAWWVVGRFVDDVVRAIAGPGRQTAEAARELKDGAVGAADQVGSLPYVGSGVRVPFDEMVKALDGMIASAESQAAAIESAATLGGWLTFLIPVLLLLVIWLPWRLRFVRRSRATRRLAGDPHGADLLALRALATHSVSELAAVSPDPVGDWRAGEPAVIARLADLELSRAGVRASPAQPSARITR